MGSGILTKKLAPNFTQMVDGTKEDYELLDELEKEFYKNLTTIPSGWYS